MDFLIFHPELYDKIYNIRRGPRPPVCFVRAIFQRSIRNMQDIKQLYDEYVPQSKLPEDWKEQVYQKLKSYKPGDLKTIEDHRLFIEVLYKLRKRNAADMRLIGKHFEETIASLLAVGEDGVYSNNLRFIYELIQNVDDCDYVNKSDCHLDICFETDPAPGKIILTYNEVGFSPFNVFSITGIAEESKNISEKKIEIGEKGIGFKSVFGVSQKVLIESGMFSFELHKENFTVPISKYEGYEPITGTRLTIYLKDDHSAEDIFNELFDRYSSSNAVLNKNPILFLNKLTHLKLEDNHNQYIEFNVEKNSIVSDKTEFEENVIIAAARQHLSGNKLKNEHEELHCRRYSTPVLYAKEECESRYGKDVAFKERKLRIVAVIPYLNNSLKNYEGVMYSFLPTQIKIQAPLILHVPYKLDGSREFVDPQGNNAWFRHTSEVLGEFIKEIFIHLAHKVKNEIVLYLPKDYVPLFKQDNEKTRCLDIGPFEADTIFEEDVFCCTDGTFSNNEGIVSFDLSESERRENFEQIFALLDESRKLFIPSDVSIDMDLFGVETISDVNRKLFYSGINNDQIFAEVISILEKSKQEINYYEYLEDVGNDVKFTCEHVRVIIKTPKLLTQYNELARDCITKSKFMHKSVSDDAGMEDASLEKEISGLMGSTELDEEFETYLKDDIEYKLLLVDIDKKEFYLPFDNALVLSKKSPLSSFALLSDYYDPRNTFSATLKISQASKKLDEASEDMTNADYLKLLRDVRLSLINAYGKKSYDSYISIVNKAGADKNRFLSELLQNADDCLYDAKVRPEFHLRISGNQLVVDYNETGFTKDNVRAITAIGESTKKLLLSGNDKSIGEKGIGFKSVFGVAKTVEIHSNGFDFILNGDRPTVPEKCTSKKNISGTQMIYELKERSLEDYFTEDKIIPLCLCLRKLKKLDINGISIQIYDEEKKRTISINGKDYELEKYRYDFEIDNIDAIKERTSDFENISSEQYVVYYNLPRNLKLTNCNLYSGLPVSKVECQIPLIIDAPFELTTARDDVLQCLWNDIVKEAVYEGIISLIDDKKYDIKLDVLKYVNYQKAGNENIITTFNSDYLNDFLWYKELRELEILPCLFVDSFISPGRDAFVVPDIIADVAYIDKDYEFAGTVIDTRHKSKYKDLLEFLGCDFCDTEDQLVFISDNVDKYLRDNKLRDSLYKYLASIREDIEYEGYEELVPELPIFPVRFEKGTEYAKYSGNLYTHDTQVSSSEYLILDTDIMSYELCQSILGSDTRINELSQEVFDEKYRTKLESLIRSNNKSDEEVADYLLNEFKNNRKALDKCIFSLKGLIEEIPMKMSSGQYKRGSKFSNVQDWFFVGNIIPQLCVGEDFKEFATYLSCGDILKIHYSDIDCDMSEGITDEEVQDILDHFENVMDILTGFIRDEVITDEQIEKFNLQYFSANSGTFDYVDDEYESFPGRKVKNSAQLKYHIEDLFYNKPNPYVKKVRIVREPKYKLDKSSYTDSMYRSQVNNKKCFCQMCKERYSLNYIERNDVQTNPKYGWEQMYLSLCLKCSKDYIYLRNVNPIWQAFIQNILDATIGLKDESVEVAIANQTITFTAVHLAEIQNILRLESEDNREFDDNGNLVSGDNQAENHTESIMIPEESNGEEDKIIEKTHGQNNKNITAASSITPERKKWMVEGKKCIFRTIPVDYLSEVPKLNEQSMLIEESSICLSIDRVVLYRDKVNLDQYVVVRFVLKNSLLQKLTINARRVNVNSQYVCKTIGIHIPSLWKNTQIVSFALPINALDKIQMIKDIHRISLYVELDADNAGNISHYESEVVTFSVDGKIMSRSSK